METGVEYGVFRGQHVCRHPRDVRCPGPTAQSVEVDLEVVGIVYESVVEVYGDSPIRRVQGRSMCDEWGVAVVGSEAEAAKYVGRTV
jgi:hypothetical protein